MKNCGKIHPLLALYREKGVTPGQQKQVETHLKTCAEAQGELEAYDQLHKSMSSLPEPQPPRDLHERIMTRLHENSLGLTAKKSQWRFPAIGLAIAACLTLFFLIQYPDVMRPNEKTSFSSSIYDKPTDQAAFKKIESSPSEPRLGTKSANRYKVESNPAKDISIQNTPIQQQSVGMNLGANKMLAQANVPAAKPFGGNGSTGATSKTQDLSSLAGSRLEASPSRESAQSLSDETLFEMNDQNRSRLAMKKGVASTVMAASVPANNIVGAIQSGVPPAPSEFAPLTTSGGFPSQSWSGSDGGSGESILLSDEETFKNYWMKLQPGKDLPPVDFSKQAVVLLGDGQTPNGAYRIRLLKLEDRTDRLIVHYQIEELSSYHFQVITTPWAIQVIDKPSKPVVFQHDP